MSKITAIEPIGKLNKRQKIFLDDGPAFSLTAKTVKETQLRVGQELDDQRVTALTAADNQNRLELSSRRYFGYRPQSEAELKQKLKLKGIPPPEIDSACAQLKASGLLDDGRFARFWKENRESFAPRSRRLINQELRRKGVPPDAIEQVTGEIDDRESAYRAAIERARRLSGSNYEVFAAKLGGYLQRRGFDYEIIKSTLARVWEEMPGTNVKNRRLSSAYQGGGIHKEVIINDQSD